MQHARPVGGGKPDVEKIDSIVIVAGLEERVYQRVGAMGIGRPLPQRALCQLSTAVPLAGLDERERMHGREPPVVAVMGGERFEECEQLGFPADATAEADGTEHAACGRQGERVAGIFVDVLADEVERLGDQAGHEQADNLDVLLFPFSRRMAQPNGSLR